MRYVEFRSQVQSCLRAHPKGLTWRELKATLDLPYRTPCPEWVNGLEREIGLQRAPVAGRGRAYVWSLQGEPSERT